MRYNLREARERKNMTQQEVADAAGIRRVTYTNIENGTRNPSFSTAMRIKKALNCSDDNIFLDLNVSN